MNFLFVVSQQQFYEKVEFIFGLSIYFLFFFFELVVKQMQNSLSVVIYSKYSEIENKREKKCK